MGPIIPNELIPAEWNFVFAILIGIAFGFIMEASGFSSSRKLVGVFYGYDFAVLKVFLTATIVAVIGLHYLDYLNWINMDQLFVQPTYLWAALVGGFIMGVGFLAGGFCPGSFLWLKPLYENSFLGHVTLDKTLNTSPYLIIFIFTLIALLAFFISDMVRKRVKKVFY